MHPVSARLQIGSAVFCGAAQLAGEGGVRHVGGAPSGFVAPESTRGAPESRRGFVVPESAGVIVEASTTT
jgi:hypothetical protein